MNTDFYTHPKLRLLEIAFDTARGALMAIEAVSLSGGNASACHEIAAQAVKSLEGIRPDLPHTQAVKKLADVLPSFNTTKGVSK